jgi:putative acetyltransferase
MPAAARLRQHRGTFLVNRCAGGRCRSRCATPVSAMRIELDDLSRPQVHALLREHLAHMHELSPADRVFALDLHKLKVPGISLWTAWEDDELLGCGALKELTPLHGEIKSMRTRATQRRRGTGAALLGHIVASARERGYELLSLETGTHPDFDAAKALYARFGFEPCGPFADYEVDPHSAFMALQLAPAG